tara:strand:- start:2477 stop:2635 length:159 start_codon:yes stop_codon:yes gene_type:complete
MTHVGYLVAGWGIVVGVLTAYAVRLARRGRALSCLVPKPRRRWLEDRGVDGS